MKKLKSKYFQQEFDATLIEKEYKGAIRLMPTTESMLDILYHQTSLETRPTVDWNMLKASYPACECIMVNMAGHRVTGYGAVVGSDAPTDGDVVRLARDRAFYDAMLLFYNFEFEIVKSKKVDASINGGETVIKDITDDAGTIKMEEQPEAKEKPVVQAPVVKNEEKTTDETNGNDNPGKVSVSFGKYAKCPKTVAEVYEIEVVGTNKDAKNWYYYMCNNMNAERYKPVLDAMKAYKAIQETN